MKKISTVPSSIIGYGALSEYNLNLFYKDFVLNNKFYPYIFDGLSDKKGYGIKNTNGQTIFPKSVSIKYTQNNNGVPFGALMFVQEAFADLKEYHNSLLNTNKLQKNFGIYASVNAESGIIDIDDLYIRYLNATYEYFYNTLTIIEKKEIIELDVFIKKFINFIKANASDYPILKSEFISSRFCPLEISGLVINIGTMHPSYSVLSSIQTYIDDPNFNTFIRSAARFGFFVDKNFPWRIIADLGSDAMKKYYKKYEMYSPEDVFENLYHDPKELELDNLKNILVGYWNTYVKNASPVLKVTPNFSCATNFAESYVLEPITEKIFSKFYDTDWLTRLLAYILFLNKSTVVHQTKFDAICNQAINIKNNIGEKQAVDFLFLLAKQHSQVASENETLTVEDKNARVQVGVGHRYLNF